MPAAPRLRPTRLLRGLHATCAVVLWACLNSAHALEVNQASEADLDALRGSGPALTARILAARQQAPFETWADLLRRVKGVGQATARQWSAQGLTVNGQPWGSTAP